MISFIRLVLYCSKGESLKLVVYFGNSAGLDLQYIYLFFVLTGKIQVKQFNNDNMSYRV